MKLKILRKRLNKTQEEVAKDLKLQKQTYQNYELGKREPDIETLKNLADYFNVSLDYLCDHKAQNQLQLGYLNDTQKTAISLLLKLNENNLLQTIGFLTAQIQNQ